MATEPQDLRPRCSSKGCNAIIYWVRTATGGWMPLDPDGVPHWVTCPAAEEFRKRKKRDEAQQGFEW